jgi:hypothetical protein
MTRALIVSTIQFQGDHCVVLLSPALCFQYMIHDAVFLNAVQNHS